MTPLPVCVIGAGRLGSRHARILSALDQVTLVGVHDRDRERGEALAARVDTAHVPELATLLSRAVAAVVAVPTVAHHAVTASALDAGLHVLVEKPLASTLEEADDLIGRSEAAGVRLCVGHVERFNAALAACAPYLRRPRYVESLRLSSFQPRGTDVTVVLDLMIHDIDLVLGLVSERVVETRAVGVPVLSGSVDIANARLIFESGAVANITASRVSATRKRQLRLFQDTGYFSLDLDTGRGEYLRRRDRPVESRDPSSLEQVVERIPLVGEEAEPLRLELEAFVRAVAGEPSPAVEAGAGRAALEVALRITREIEEFSHVVAQDS